jgi:hypothetical protein
MSNQGFSQDGPLTYLAGAPIATNLLVTLTGTAGTVVLCGAAGFPVGIADGAVASGAYGSFKVMRGRVQVFGTAAAGDFVKAGAAGVVVAEAGVTTRTGNTIGQAETAATAGRLWIVCL